MDFEIGDHLYSRRSAYTHHGIYVGQRLVIHYSGLASGMEAGPIEVTSVQAFGNGRKVRVMTRKRGAFPRREIVDRAYSRLGEDEYDLTDNNCEHFANWCVYGKSKSEQVESVTNVLNELAIRSTQRRSGQWPLGPGKLPGPPVLHTPIPIPTNPVEEVLKNLPGTYTYSNPSGSGTVETVVKTLGAVASLFTLKSFF